LPQDKPYFEIDNVSLLDTANKLIKKIRKRILNQLTKERMKSMRRSSSAQRDSMWGSEPNVNIVLKFLNERSYLYGTE